ncbi:MAG: hypothetical protein U5L05_18145 [Rubrivivax sp.]|nr:hypothetical protein [Rubrivivax sp.]
MPVWPGQETFNGPHRRTRAPRESGNSRASAPNGRALVLVGGSKAASDLALVLVRAGAPFQWLMRRMYWFLSFDKGYFDAERQAPSRLFHRLLYFAGLGLAKGPLEHCVYLPVSGA